MSASLKDDIENAVRYKRLSEGYVSMSTIRAAMQKNADRAAFCHAKGNESSEPVVKMSYLAEANGLLQANINILEQLRKDGSI